MVGPSKNRRLGVLISGRGSNLQSIIDATETGRLDATIAVVIANKEDAGGLERARRVGVDTAVLKHTSYESREAYDGALINELRRRDVGLVCLAGFMRLLSVRFVEAFPNRIVNIHPSLLPAFPGLDGQGQAWTHGVKVAGATVHVVTPELDAGPIVLQATVPVYDTDTPEDLATRILMEEHRIYPEAIAIILGGGWRIEGRRFLRE
ncbi:MAG TPA: phosphoribosylglycinamide formyltransferase [Acidobacteria bacterium]|jgi:phosphoribosylglycinamide formyltransferase-1|nr:phosphoribosylglycinamide formyltransferase [Acidobacteriota bacterium]|tara:strand:- start:418 stop:1038 length:621 start_codon:yes stop_codon:yes gene_type:complete